jgi:hypothetical protein
VSKTFGEWYQKTNKTEDTNKLNSLAFKTIIILHNTQLATFITILETVSKGLFRNRSQNTHKRQTSMPAAGFEPKITCKGASVVPRLTTFGHWDRHKSDLRPIHTYHAVPLPLPCHSPTVLCPSWKFLILCMKFSCYLLPGTTFH